MPKVLLIDDEEPIRKIVGLYLQSHGYEVITAADSQKAMELFQPENPSVVLTDIKMPGMDGIEVLRRIKQTSPETEVIVITGHGDMDLAVQSLQLDASDFITKPVGNNDLTQTCMILWQCPAESNRKSRPLPRFDSTEISPPCS